MTDPRGGPHDGPDSDGGAPVRYDAIVLTGGAGRRMGRSDKPALRVGNTALVVRVAGAARHAARLIVVGSGHPGLAAHVLTREEPPGGGPVAALATGSAHLSAPLTAVLAADLPFLTAEVVDLLARAAANHDLAVLVDDAGRDQLLVAVWRTAALRTALAAVHPPVGVSVRRLVAAAGDVARVTLTEPHTGLPTDPPIPPPWFDCDTPEDLLRARRLVR